jgi:hypothetical protein
VVVTNTTDRPATFAVRHSGTVETHPGVVASGQPTGSG